MYIVDSYSLAVIFCIITMLGWGSWANTQKRVGKTSLLGLFHWDYLVGVVEGAIGPDCPAGRTSAPVTSSSRASGCQRKRSVMP